MTAIVACSISVLALIGQALEQERTEVRVDHFAFEAMAGALQDEPRIDPEAGWAESIQHAVDAAIGSVS